MELECESLSVSEMEISGSSLLRLACALRRVDVEPEWSDPLPLDTLDPDPGAEADPLDGEALDSEADALTLALDALEVLELEAEFESLESRRRRRSRLDWRLMDGQRAGAPLDGCWLNGWDG